MRRFENQTIAQYVYSKMRAERIFRYILIIYSLLWSIITVILLADYDNERMALIIFLITPLLAGVIIYFGHYYSYFRSTKWLHTKSSDILNEIQLGKAVISLTPYAVIPYSQIAWVYLDPFYGEDSEPIYYTLIIYCKDGTSFKIESDSEDWYEKIISEIPEVISGIGSEKRKQYLQGNPEASAKRDRTKCVWGVILLLLMACLSSISIINESIKPMGVVLLTALLIGGIWLLWQGKKTNNK